jgi:NADH:ubiquinone oxidoreductase subunit 6 (subunit J)
MFGLGLPELLVLFIIGAVIGVGLFLPMFINYKLVKSRNREKEICLWMLLTLLFSWLVTLILAVMKPKDQGLE